jgi:hypothetical protein
MKKRTLFDELPGTYPWVGRIDRKPPKPDTVHYFFLERGYVMEYFQAGDQRIVALFFGPGEFVIPADIDRSCFEMLDSVIAESVTYGAVIRALRNYADADLQYRKIQQCYREKVAERLKVLGLPPVERFAWLRVKQPWVLELVAERDVADYLGISVEVLRAHVACRDKGQT